MMNQPAVSLLALALCLASDVRAATYTVTSVGDDGAGSLRQAMLDANGDGGSGVDIIGFDIPGSGPHTIQLASQLPAIARDLTIDGYSQPGSVMNSLAPDQGGLDAQIMIEITGPGAGTGFHYACCANPYMTLTVQGVALHGFTSAIAGQSAFSTPHAMINVYGCYIGTSRTGSALPAEGNSGAAVAVGYDNAQVGGRLPWQRNLLSGNGAGVIGGSPNATLVIEGNLIGTDASGTLAIPNGANTHWPGVWLQGHFAGVRMGCSGSGCMDASSRNVISGNQVAGVGIWDVFSQSSGGMEIKGNFIGSDWSGTRSLANGGPGVELQGNPALYPPITVIGGFGAGEGNLIAWNLGGGIVSASNRPGESFDMQGDTIHHNHAVPGIDIGLHGPTPNDVDDADTGANDVQNWPVILSASQSGSGLTVSYRIDTTTANATYPLYVDFYRNIQGGSGALLGEDVYDAAHAQLPRTVVLTLADPDDALPFVATATDSRGFSSEFSPAFDVLFEDDFD
jgi:hypothetical protein